ncbi:hypothetical protein L1887_39333 [Cichorium endivia]|nr:hypothetical protein L1887_39333 [Cichorium endivia]
MNLVPTDENKKVLNPFEIFARLKELSDGLACDPKLVSDKVCGRYHRTSEIIPQTAIDMAADHPDYATLATRITVSNLHKNTKASFSETIKDIYERSGQKDPLVADDVYAIIMEHAAKFDSEIKHERDLDYDYIGLKILEKSYLLKIKGKVVERPQHMLMRVAVGIHKHDTNSVIMTYRLTSERCFTHASPTLFNAGKPKPQLSSCFLVRMKDDSIESICDAVKECAIISESPGGIGVSVHNIRSISSYIRGKNATFSPIIPMLRILNDTARYDYEKGYKRKSAIAVYLEPWHTDIFEYLDLRKKHVERVQRIMIEDQEPQDLFYALWVPDLFMERVESDGSWSLFCPSEAPCLADCWGQGFEELYTQYEREGKAKKVVKAKKLWFAVLKSQIESGTPYMLFKDSCNRKSNQKNLGTITSSNLCAEIIEYTSPTETAMCNLASIALPQCVQQMITSIVTTNLNKIIDVNYYPVETAKRSNLRHRPIGIGVQGLADTFVLLGMPFDSEKAQKLNKDIFETIYYHALKSSCELAKKEGIYETYAGSPVSKWFLCGEQAFAA